MPVVGVDISSPAGYLSGHFRSKYGEHAVQRGYHEWAAEGGISQVNVAGNIILINHGVFINQFGKNLSMTLPPRVGERFRVTRIRRRRSVGHSRIVEVVTEGGIHIPQRIGPFGSGVRGGRIDASPPGCIPVQPVGTNRVGINAEIIDEASPVVLGIHLGKIGRVAHIVVLNELTKSSPIILCLDSPVISPGSAPCFQVLNVRLFYTVIMFYVILIICFFTNFIDAPELTVFVKHHGF